MRAPLRGASIKQHCVPQKKRRRACVRSVSPGPPRISESPVVEQRRADCAGLKDFYRVLLCRCGGWPPRLRRELQYCRVLAGAKVREQHDLAIGKL